MVPVVEAPEERRHTVIVPVVEAPEERRHTVMVPIVEALEERRHTVMVPVVEAPKDVQITIESTAATEEFKVETIDSNVESVNPQSIVSPKSSEGGNKKNKKKNRK